MQYFKLHDAMKLCIWKLNYVFVLYNIAFFNNLVNASL